VLSVLSVVRNLLLQTCCPKLARGFVAREADLSEPNGRTLFKEEDSTSLAMLAGWATPTTMASAFSLANRFLYLILRALEPS